MGLMSGLKGGFVHVSRFDGLLKLTLLLLVRCQCAISWNSKHCRANGL